MEERVPPSADNNGNLDIDNHNHVHGPLPPLPASDPEHVLVVQIPKDQIYRVPPPENALIIERHRNPPKKANQKKLCGCCSWCSCLSIWVVILALVAIFVMIRTLPSTMSFAFLPRVPVYRIEHFSVKNLTHSAHHENKSHLHYEITLKDENKNPVTGILYHEDGIVSLLCRGKEIAGGKYPAFNQDGKETKDVKLTLEGLNIHLPEDINKSMKSTTPKVHVPFLLEMDVPAGMKIGLLKSGTLKFTVSCNFVVDTLGEKQGTRILSQECVTRRTRL
ncbi:NDR1/HIN1-like protein 13 [Punica granatum]|uniref:Uncharacterized protein n=2 Tax=Punica granatum TaxID=22663 RepID=A0A218XZ60_PUNGR|nr:NDR1/HIN1-like protein 13 [Punica granatum]OWM90244.1 hypothetical protein CDL15_Pgr006565 [Punica granatum]PKI52736.1 hypothetical protein CRG98_026857 [Punica granatum]